jgi:hypothetical protein
MDLFNTVLYSIMLVLVIILIILAFMMLYLNFKLWLLETYNADNKNIYIKFLHKIFNIDFD